MRVILGMYMMEMINTKENQQAIANVTGTVMVYLQQRWPRQMYKGMCLWSTDASSYGNFHYQSKCTSK